jgi:hypothetical protein
MEDGRDKAISAFVSWAHEGEERERQVGALVGALRVLGGIEADADLFHLTESDIDKRSLTHATGSWSSYLHAG